MVAVAAARASAAATRPRLVYLPFRAMAETSRMMLAHGGIEYEDEAVWGTEFQRRKSAGDFPYDKTPVLQLPGCEVGSGRTVAQSGAIARWSARLSGCYPAHPARAALADAVYELGQELCTINPLVNCYTGPNFERIQRYYFSEVLPQALPQLERQLAAAAEASTPRIGGLSPVLAGDVFFAGGGMEGAGESAEDGPSLADFNIFHHLDNAQLLEPDLLHGYNALGRWQQRMLALPRLQSYLSRRPTLNGIGEDPGLEDRHGVRVTQRTPGGRAWLRDGLWCLDA
jgi:glutathione S-transferase